MSATVVYDPELLVPYYTGAVEDGQASYYNVAAPPGSFLMQIGPWTIGAGPAYPSEVGQGQGFEVDVLDRNLSYADVIDWSTVVTEVGGLGVQFVPGDRGCCGSGAWLGLVDPSSTTLPSSSLADVPLDPSLWGGGRFGVDLGLPPDGNSSISVSGTITSFSAQTVPEPDTGVTTFMALLAFGLVRCRCRA